MVGLARRCAGHTALLCSGSIAASQPSANTSAGGASANTSAGGACARLAASAAMSCPTQPVQRGCVPVEKVQEPEFHDWACMSTCVFGRGDGALVPSVVTWFSCDARPVSPGGAAAARHMSWPGMVRYWLESARLPSCAALVHGLILQPAALIETWSSSSSSCSSSSSSSSSSSTARAAAQRWRALALCLPLLADKNSLPSSATEM